MPNKFFSKKEKELEIRHYAFESCSNLPFVDGYLVFFVFRQALAMAGHLLKSLTDALVSFEYVFLSPLFRRPPTPHLIPLMVQQSHQPALKDTPFNINEIFDGFLWGVPTCRRSVEKRMMRKFGAPNWHNKLILPKKNLKVCGSCGHYHEEKRLCGE